MFFLFPFFFTPPPSPDIYTLSLHDALPISEHHTGPRVGQGPTRRREGPRAGPRRAGGQVQSSDQPVTAQQAPLRSEEHTSELQSLRHLVCRLLLEKKKKKYRKKQTTTTHRQ